MATLRLLQQHLPPLAFDIVKLANGLILLAVLLIPLERLFALRPQKVFRHGFFTDIGYYFVTSLLPARVLVLPLTALALAVQHFAPSAPRLWVSAWPFWLRIAASLLIAELGFYWGHRWMHSNPWLWRFHAIHHGPAGMDWLVNTHAHPVDLIITRLCGYIPLYLLGLAQIAPGRIDWIPLLVALVGSLWGYFIHANLRWRYGWLEHVIATPAFHHWHHDNVAPGIAHKNYSPLFPLVDRIFGTLQPTGSGWPRAYGIREPGEDGMAGQLIQPFLPVATVAAATRSPDKITAP